jgi:hypothetical protein
MGYCSRRFRPALRRAKKSRPGQSVGRVPLPGRGQVMRTANCPCGPSHQRATQRDRGDDKRHQRIIAVTTTLAGRHSRTMAVPISRGRPKTVRNEPPNNQSTAPNNPPSAAAVALDRPSAPRHPCLASAQIDRRVIIHHNQRRWRAVRVPTWKRHPSGCASSESEAGGCVGRGHPRPSVRAELGCRWNDDAR